MISLYVDGKKVGTLADAERLLPELLAQNRQVELRNEAGVPVGAVDPTPPAADPERPVPWDPTITRADIDRMLTEPGYTFEEVEKMLGWVPSSEKGHTGYTAHISPLAYLRAMGSLFWSAIRHPLSNTTIDLQTGRVLYRT